MNLKILRYFFLVGIGSLSSSLSEEASPQYFIKERVGYLVVKSTVDQRYYLLVDPGAGVYTVEIVSHDLREGNLAVKLVNRIGLSIDFDSDGEPEEDSEILGKIIQIKQSRPMKIFETKASYSKKIK